MVGRMRITGFRILSGKQIVSRLLLDTVLSWRISWGEKFEKERKQKGE